MNKALELLEEYCQWIAVALGGLFLVWVLYAYVLSTPVSVPDTIAGGASGAVLTPGNVDNKVADVANRLKNEIDSADVPKPSEKGTEVVEPWLTSFLGKDLRRFQIASTWSSSSPGEIISTEDGGDKIQRDVVTELPTLPPAIPVDVKSARASIDPAQPIVVSQPGQPNQPAPPPAAAPGQPGALPVAAKDLTYVKFDYSIPLGNVADAFAAAKIGQGINNTSVIAVKIMRRQKKSDGTWTEPAEIQRIADGAQVLAIPKESQGQPLKDFLNWAEDPNTPSTLLRPTFYHVYAGEGPFDPPAVIPVEQMEAAKKAAEEQKAMERKAAADQAAADRASKRANPPPGARGPGRYPGGEEGGGPPGGPRGTRRPPNRGIADPDRASVGPLGEARAPARERFAQYRPPYAPGGAPGNQYPPPGGYPPGGVPGNGEEGNGGFMGLPQPGQPGAGQPPSAPLPQPVFQPSGQQPITAWAYDTNVEEGKTYQYQAIYALRNPVFNANENVAKPEIAQTFSIWSKLDDAAWSREVAVEPSTYFFIAQNNWRPAAIPSAVQMVVYKWAAGRWQKATVPNGGVAPGDRIGTSINKPAVDFATPDTLVDIRFDTRQQRPFIVVLGPNGELLERDPKTDNDSKIRAALDLLVQQSTPPVDAAAAAGNFGNGGGIVQP